MIGSEALRVEHSAVKVVICSAVWGRPALTDVWWKGVARIRECWRAHGWEVEVLVGGDEPEHFRMAVENDARWVHTANWPLGAKWNTIIERAAIGAPDALFIIGSDDFLSQKLIEEYPKVWERSQPHVGLTGMFFFEPASFKRAYTTRPVGAGRLFATDLLQKCHFRPWGDQRPRGLDGALGRVIGEPVERLVVGPELVALDVKTATNLWTFDILSEAFDDLKTMPRMAFHIPEWRSITTLRPEKEPKIIYRPPKVEWAQRVRDQEDASQIRIIAQDSGTERKEA